MEWRASGAQGYQQHNHLCSIKQMSNIEHEQLLGPCEISAFHNPTKKNCTLQKPENTMCYAVCLIPISNVVKKNTLCTTKIFCGVRSFDTGCVSRTRYAGKHGCMHLIGQVFLRGNPTPAPHGEMHFHLPGGRVNRAPQGWGVSIDRDQYFNWHQRPEKENFVNGAYAADSIIPKNKFGETKKRSYKKVQSLQRKLKRM